MVQTNAGDKDGSQTLSVQIFVDHDCSDAAFSAMKKIMNDKASFEAFYIDQVDQLSVTKPSSELDVQFHSLDESDTKAKAVMIHNAIISTAASKAISGKLSSERDVRHMRDTGLSRCFRTGRL